MYNNSNIFEEVDFTINSQNLNKLQDNISSEGSVQLSVSFQKENFAIHQVNDPWDEKKIKFEKQWGLNRKDEKLQKSEANKKRISNLLDDKKLRKMSFIENGNILIKTYHFI